MSAYQQNSSGITDVNGANGNEIQFFATTAVGMLIRALYKDYILICLNHVNTVNGIAYKDARLRH
jgi:hypothetical protein